jgi:thymidylate synthase
MIYEGFAEAYENELSRILYEPEFETRPRGLKIQENLDVKIEILNPYLNLFKNEVRSIPLSYLAYELILYFSGTNRASDFVKASPFWDKIKNSDGTVNSAYGNLLFNLGQWDWAKNSLKKDKDSRQAIMHYNRPEHLDGNSKDIPCTMSSQFFIRNEKLHLTTYMRSNDIFFGLTFDLPFFMLLMQCMRLELLYYYCNLELGSYTHFAGSLHAYEKDFEILDRMLSGNFSNDKMPKIETNPILHPDIEAMRLGLKPKGNDIFFKWLYSNLKDD